MAEFEANFTLNNEQNIDALFEIYASGTTWGNIDGNISNQIDLKNVLDSKASNTRVDEIVNTYDYEIGNINSDITSINETLQSYGNIVTHDAADFATSAQGALADTALQPNDNITELVNNAGYITSADLPTLADLTTTAQLNAINSGITTSGVSQITTNTNNIANIENLIPVQATSSNQLADKNFVNSSIATNTANFIGTFNSLAELEAYTGPLTNNDYAFVATTDTAGNTLYDRYKYNATENEWLFEYELNNSSFTANQWAAINSGITSGDVALIATAVQPSDLATVATTGAYSDLTGAPTVNNATITLTQGGVSKGTFTLNQSNDATINLEAGGGGAVDSVNGQTGDVVLTASDVGALPNTTVIPTKTSDLTNNSGFITNTVNNLTNYYLKSETYTKLEVQQLITSIPKFTVVVVQALPVTGQSMTLYLLPKDGEAPDVYEEYIWVTETETYELIGSTAVDLDGYATEDWVEAKGYATETFVNNGLATKQDVLTAGTDLEIVTASGGDSTVSGTTSIVLENATDDGLNSVTLTGECVQNGTPTPTTPVDIICNNGKIGVDANGNIITTGTVETVTDSNQSTATAEMLLSVGNYKDTQEVLTGTVTRKVDFKVLDGTEEWAISNVNDNPFFRLNNAVVYSGNLTYGFYCTHFETASISGTNTLQGIRIYSNSIFLRYDSLFIATSSNLSAFKSWLGAQYASGTPVILVFPKETTSTTTVTPQTLTTISGNNTLTITQASLTNLSISANYDYAKTTTINFTNASGYTKNTGTVTSVNNVQPDTNGNVTLNIDNAISTTSTNPVQNKAIPSYIVSRGENLVSNGFATLGNNYNFSTMTYTGADTYGAGGCFYYTSSTNGRVRSDEYMPIDITQSYKLSYAVKNTTLTTTYDFIDMYDIDFNRIAAGNCGFTAGTTTTLAQDLKNGDTVIYFTDLSNWNTESTSQYLRALIFWKYKNSFGYEYPTEYYSRYWWYNLWADSSVAIDKVNNTITLPSGWTHGSFSAGHPVSQGTLSGANVYGNSGYKPTPNEWTVKTYTFDPSKYRNATAYIQLGWLTNYSNQTDNTFSVSSISFTSNVNLIDFVAYTASEVETLWGSI